ncbi:hypothetical protein BR63_03645 [Thermanaerosceptrum fracticalcis]|uniref:PD-(D/E)XK nuclease superfamily protein n=1 Tax=Thermanaerosceptrum fracticalcis TaxID=1712410 RepID=A0A7G6E086_THEFR|nr:PD-(D/E)XK nuclease family protein [Thermanaerosceptrum fracticalcis]QNB45490.1 hypothetical protein BR63_03645 [Thermanaerosceptrum fracticalcis]
MNFNPEELTPIFHSEISSSYILMEFLRQGENCLKFLAYMYKKGLGPLNPQNYRVESIEREKMYKGKGAIDIYIRLKHASGRSIIVLIEVKVHDYDSYKFNQIGTYFEAARESEDSQDIYFIYLTQFNKQCFQDKTDVSQPGTVEEFRGAETDYPGRIAHVSWPDFYAFIDEKIATITPTLEHLVILQRTWITDKIKRDLAKYAVNTLDREFGYYFPNTQQRMQELKELGEEKAKRGAKVLEIDLKKLSADEVMKIAEVIEHYADSKDVERKASYVTGEDTLNAVRKFLGELVLRPENWSLLSFYFRVFSIFQTRSYLLLNGTGSQGYSVKLKTVTAREISLCTLWKNHVIDFRLAR